MSIMAGIASATHAQRQPAQKPVKDWTTPEEQGGTDSTAIQAAVDTGLTVIMANSYTIDATCDLTTKTGQAFTGGGTVTLDDSRTIGTQMFQGDGVNKVSFRHLTFDGNKANQTQPDDSGTWNSGAPRVYYTPIDIFNSNGLTVEECEFFDVSTSSVNWWGTNTVRVSGNYFHDSYMDPIFTNGEKDLTKAEASSDVRIERNLVEDITYRDGEGAIIYRYGNGIIANCNAMVISRNVINRVDRSGMKTADKDRENILVEYNTIADASWDGISSQGGSDTTIRYNDCIDCGVRGIGVLGNVGGTRSGIIVEYNNVVRPCFGTEPGAKGGVVIGTLPDTITGTIVRNNTVTDSDNIGIYMVDMVDGFVQNNTITDSSTVGINFGSSSPTDLSDNVLVSGNIIDGALDGIKLLNEDTDLDIDGNTISNIGRYGIWLEVPDRATIQNNTVNDAVNMCIINRSATNTIIDNNNCNNAGQDGINLNGTPESDTTTITNNDMDSCARYGINIPGAATNVTIGAGNTYTNIGVADINWPAGP